MENTNQDGFSGWKVGFLHLERCMLFPKEVHWHKKIVMKKFPFLPPFLSSSRVLFKAVFNSE